jgi:2-polyprenyl-3-methyl-5-hydroxy-6-metoxy-1,4-benzoquinol methylase
MNPRIPPPRIGQFYPKTYYTNNDGGASLDQPSFRNRLKQTLQATHLGYPKPSPGGLPALVGSLLSKLLMKTPPMRRQINWVPNGRVLDVGCGNGEMLDQYRALGWQTTGVEPGHESAELAREKGHCVFTGLVEEANLPSESFDAITLWDALEHIPNPTQVTGEVYRLLRPNGKVYIHVPNYGSCYGQYWKDRWFMFTAPLHYYHYSSTTITELLQRNGFTSIDVSTGLGELGWRQSVLAGKPRDTLQSKILGSRPAIRIGNIIENVLPGGHLTAVARKPNSARLR